MDCLLSDQAVFLLFLCFSPTCDKKGVQNLRLCYIYYIPSYINLINRCLRHQRMIVRGKGDCMKTFKCILAGAVSVLLLAGCAPMEPAMAKNRKPAICRLYPPAVLASWWAKTPST